MNELKLFETLKEAYGASTHNFNKFKQVIDSIQWTDKFYADNEYYFIIGNFTFTTPSLNSFDCEWEPSVLFSDGGQLEF